MSHTEPTTQEDAAAASPAREADAPAPADASSHAAQAAPARPSSREGDCTAELKQRFPALFTGPVKPLKLKIQADIQQRAPGVFGKQQLAAFFRRYTGSTGYLIALTKATHRYDLDGQESGELSAEHRQAALDELARRRANHQAQFEQQEQARRQRAALLRDFEGTTLTPANFCALKGITPQALEALLASARKEREERARQGPGPHRRGPHAPHATRASSPAESAPTPGAPHAPRRSPRAPAPGDPRGERRPPARGKGGPRPGREGSGR